MIACMSVVFAFTWKLLTSGNRQPLQEAGIRSAAAVRSAPGVLGDKIWSALEYVVDSVRGATGYATNTARAAANAPRRALESAAAQFDEGFHKSDANPSPDEGPGVAGGAHAQRSYADALREGETGSGQPGDRETLEQGKAPGQGGGGRTGGSSVLSKAGEAARHVQDTAEHLAGKVRSAGLPTAGQGLRCVFEVERLLIPKEGVPACKLGWYSRA